MVDFKISMFLIAGLLSVSAQGASITLAGSNLGFTLSTVITNTPNSFPVGIAVNSDGDIMFNNYSGGVTAVIADVDNQNYSTPGTVLHSSNNGVSVPGMAFSNGFVWQGGGSLHRLNNNATVAQTFANISFSVGMWTNPVNGHLVGLGAVSGLGSGLIDVDVSNPNAPIGTLIKSGVGGDGVTVSPDGQKAYTSAGSIVDLVSAAHPVTSFSPPSGADGMGIIISNNALNGSIVVNAGSSGGIYLVNPTTFAATLIANGNGYGDFTGSDQTNGTLLLGSGNSILRLSCGTDCGIGSAPVSGDTPEPSTFLLSGLGLGAVSLIRRARAL